MALRALDPKDPEDQETLLAKNKAMGALEAVENAYYQDGTATWEDVEKARNDYFDAWEDRRDYVLNKKYPERKTA